MKMIKFKLLLTILLFTVNINAQTEKRSKADWLELYQKSVEHYQNGVTQLNTEVNNFIHRIDSVSNLKMDANYVSQFQFDIWKDGFAYTYNCLDKLGDHPENRVDKDSILTLEYITESDCFSKIFGKYSFQLIPLRIDSLIPLNHYSKKELSVLITTLIEKIKAADSENQKRHVSVEKMEPLLYLYAVQLRDRCVQNTQSFTLIQSASTRIIPRFKQLKLEYNTKDKNAFPEVYHEVFKPGIDDPPVAEPIIDFGLDELPENVRDELGSVQIYERVDSQAEFPAGYDAMMKFIRDNAVVPKAVYDRNLNETCYVRFVVRENGEVTNVGTRKESLICPECDNELIRIVKAMPNWVPAKVKGKNVNSWFIFPITFGSN